MFKKERLFTCLDKPDEVDQDRLWREFVNKEEHSSEPKYPFINQAPFGLDKLNRYRTSTSEALASARICRYNKGPAGRPSRILRNRTQIDEIFTSRS